MSNLSDISSYKVTNLFSSMTSFNLHYFVRGLISKKVTLGFRASTNAFWGSPKFMSFSHAKYTGSIPAAPKVLIHSSINSKIPSLT